MALVRPGKSKAKLRVPRPLHLSKPLPHVPSAFSDDDSTFKTSKKDKRRMKHSVLLSKAQKSSDKPAGIRKRRRPSKKLVTNLDALADALPDLPSSAAGGAEPGRSIINLKSLPSKPGVQKKRDMLGRDERDRFGRNLAVLTQARAAEENRKTTAATEPSAPTSLNRWAALRQHISGNMGTTAAVQRG